MRLFGWIALAMGAGAVLGPVVLHLVVSGGSLLAREFEWRTFALGWVQVAAGLTVLWRTAPPTRAPMQWRLADMFAVVLHAGLLLLLFYGAVKPKKFLPICVPITGFFSVGFFVGLCWAQRCALTQWRHKLPFAYGINLLMNALLVTGAATTHLWTFWWEGCATFGALAAGVALIWAVRRPTHGTETIVRLEANDAARGF